MSSIGPDHVQITEVQNAEHESEDADYEYWDETYPSVCLHLQLSSPWYDEAVLETRVNILSRQIDRIRREQLHRYNARLDSAEGMIKVFHDTLKNMITAVSEKVCKLFGEVNILDKEMGLVRADADASEKRIGGLEREVTELKKSCKVLEEKTKGMEQLKIYNTELESRVAALERLNMAKENV